MNDLEQCGHLCWAGSASSRSSRVGKGSDFRLKDCNLFSMDSGRGSGSVCGGALLLLLFFGTLISDFNFSLRLVLNLAVVVVVTVAVVLVGGGLDLDDGALPTSFAWGLAFPALGSVDDNDDDDDDGGSGGGGFSLTAGLAEAFE